MASMAGKVTTPGIAVYCATKVAVVALSPPASLFRVTRAPGVRPPGRAAPGSGGRARPSTGPARRRAARRTSARA
ncbi:hypothetical protein AB0L25_31375 [Spirillospora sp. NPDC052242]